MLKLRLIDLKAISSDSLALKKYFFLQIFARHKATKSFYQENLNKERKTFKNSKAGSFPKGGLQRSASFLIELPFETIGFLYGLKSHYYFNQDKIKTLCDSSKVNSMTLITNLKFLFQSLFCQRTCSLSPRFHDRLSKLIFFIKSRLELSAITTK